MIADKWLVIVHKFVNIWLINCLTSVLDKLALVGQQSDILQNRNLILQNTE